MYGLDFIAQGPFYLISIVLAFVVMIIGSITDFQKREVADWINFGFFLTAIALRLLYSAITLELGVILDGLIGFILFAGFGFAMFYMGQWGGGDTKMIIGVGTLFGLQIIPFDWFAISNSLLVSFFVNSLLLGSLYGLVWSIVLVVKNRKKFLSNWKILSNEFRYYRYVFLALGTVSIIAGMILQDFGIIMVPVGVMVIILMYSFLFTKSIEKGCMIFQLPLSKVTEGDWIERNVIVRGKYICGPKDLGISKKQIATLKRLKVRRIPVKVGIPFVPSFLLGLLGTFFFGNLITLIITVVLSI